MALAVLLAGVLFGSVTIGPTAPVCRAGAPCARPAGNVTLAFVSPGRTVTARTDPAGRYRLVLPLGLWAVRASSGMRVAPAVVRVRAGVHRLDLAIDTGIR